MKKVTIILIFLMFGLECLANDLKLESLCNLHKNDTESIDCYNNEYKYWDKKLNEYYQNLIKTLDQEAKIRLKNSQRAWIKEKNQVCSTKVDKVAAAQCLSLMTKQQSKKIKEQIQLFEGYWSGEIHGNGLGLESYKFYLQSGKNICGITRKTQYYMDKGSVISTGKSALYYDYYEQIKPNLAKKKGYCNSKGCFDINNLGQQNTEASYLMVCVDKRPVNSGDTVMFEIKEVNNGLNCSDLLDRFVDTRVATLSRFVYSDESPKEQQFLQDNRWLTDCLNSED